MFFFISGNKMSRLILFRHNVDKYQCSSNRCVLHPGIHTQNGGHVPDFVGRVKQ